MDNVFARFYILGHGKNFFNLNMESETREYHAFHTKKFNLDRSVVGSDGYKTMLLVSS